MTEEPSFITHDTVNSKYIVNKIDDNSLAGKYILRIKGVATYKDDVTDPSSTADFLVLTTITFRIEERCVASNLSTRTVFADPVVQELKSPAFNLPFLFEFDVNRLSCTFAIAYTFTPAAG